MGQVPQRGLTAQPGGMKESWVKRLQLTASEFLRAEVTGV